MEASMALRGMVEMSGLTHRQIETRAGRYGGWIGQSLARPRPGADLVADVARACGYRLELVPMDGGAPIVIGDGMDEGSTVAPIEEARALIARASALLDEVTATTDEGAA
jgi:hypothetical protein